MKAKSKDECYVEGCCLISGFVKGDSGKASKSDEDLKGSWHERPLTGKWA
jgi:hypothetical protein